MTTCSALSRELAESLVATAPVATAWIVIEVPGAWGRQALTECALPDDVGQVLLDRCRDPGTTPLLARRPGPAGREPVSSYRVWLAHTTPGATRMWTASLTDPRHLLDLDPAALAAGNTPALGEPSHEPVLFVCANSKRDACCAQWGRPIARALGESAVGDRVWECSHLGGHRFAATALVLPWGTVHGRLDTASAASVLAGADTGILDLDNYRGRSALQPWAQAAEIAVRRAHSIVGVEALQVEGEPPLAHVQAADGRRWSVVVESSPRTPDRNDSCTGEPVSGTLWHATDVARFTS